MNSSDKYKAAKAEITAIYHENKGRYGYRRITAELHKRNFLLNHKTVQRLMKELGLVCRVRMKKYRSYKGDGKGMDLPYIAAWHQAPIHDKRRENYRLNLQFFSFRRAANKIKYLAGSESGMAAWVSDTTPELIAKRFHELGPIDIEG